MRERIKEAMKSAAWMFLLMWGTILSGVSLVLVFAALLGHVPIWHSAIAAASAMLSLTLSYIVS